jgi:hypothetical protein
MNKVVVATDVCAELPPLVGINLDCSICTIGWPMRKGIIRVKFYGPPCKRWWCVNNGEAGFQCVEAITAPANTASGPYQNEPDCLLACSSSSDPYWCNGMTCTQSATQPGVCDTGPFSTFGDCVASCPEADTPRMESFWLFGFEAAPGFYQCYQPGTDMEPDPSRWGADWFSTKYRVQSELTVVDTNTINVSVNVFANSPRSIWQSYISFSAEMTESSCTSGSVLPYRLRYFDSGYLPVSPSTTGGIGDPISGATIHVELYGEKLGCGFPNSFTEEVGPICGMWDSSAWHTCFRAHVEAPAIGTEKAQPGVMVEMGLKKEPTGAGGGAIDYAECDQIYRDPPVTGAWKTRWNTGGYEASFKAAYQYIGFNGESSNDTQQIQLGRISGYNLCVKKIGTRTMQMGIQDPSTSAWEVVDLSTVQAGYPWIHLAVFPVIGITIYLYSMRYPSAEILPGECCQVMFPESENCDPPRATEGALFFAEAKVVSEQRLAEIKKPNPILQRMKLPCVNLGAFVENRKLNCGCGTFSVFECKKHEQCVRIAPGSYTEMAHCDNCANYSTEVEPQ